MSFSNYPTNRAGHFSSVPRVCITDNTTELCYFQQRQIYFDPEDGNFMFLRNVGVHLENNTIKPSVVTNKKYSKTSNTLPTLRGQRCHLQADNADDIQLILIMEKKISRYF
jgi:hypothetical protein